MISFYGGMIVAVMLKPYEVVSLTLPVKSRKKLGALSILKVQIRYLGDCGFLG